MFRCEEFVYTDLLFAVAIINRPYSDFSNIRSFALFARGLPLRSSSPGRIGFPLITFPLLFFPQIQTGKDDGQVHGFSALLKAVFTIRSSRE